MADTTDAPLVERFRAGDQTAFAEIYDRYADRVYSYCLTMLRSREDAADAVHDTFVKAANGMKQLDDPNKLRPWLFSLARNEAHGEGRRRSRVTPEDHLSEANIEDPDSAMQVKQDELRELVWSAAAGLGERDRDLMSFHLVEGLEDDDLADAMGVETSHVHVLVPRMKDRVEKAMGSLLIARLGSDDCDQLRAVQDDWDGTFDIDVRSKVTRHVESCEICQERRAFLLTPANVLAEILLVPAPSALRDRVLASLETGGSVLAGATSKPWVKMAGFGVVTLIMGLIGLAVSAQFEQIVTPPTIPVPTPASTLVGPGTTTTTTLSGSAPTTLAQGVTTPTTIATDAVLQLDKTNIDFGNSDTVRSLEVTNTGGLSAAWETTTGAAGITVSPSSGDLAGGVSVTIEVTLDRATAPEGDLAETLEVGWQGGSFSVSMVGTNNVNPVLHNPKASPATLKVNAGASCNPTQSTVSVRVRDASPLSSVVVRWAGQESQMIDVGNEMWEGVVGPFDTVQQESIRIVAFDEHGNAGGAAITVDVTPCP